MHRRRFTLLLLFHKVFRRYKKIIILFRWLCLSLGICIEVIHIVAFQRSISVIVKFSTPKCYLIVLHRWLLHESWRNKISSQFNICFLVYYTLLLNNEWKLIHFHVSNKYWHNNIKSCPYNNIIPWSIAVIIMKHFLPYDSLVSNKIINYWSLIILG